MKIRQLTKDDVKIHMRADRDIAAPNTHKCLYTIEEIERAEEAIKKGNVWGWSVITIRVVYAGFWGEDALCACIYDDADDFLARSYKRYESLVSRALVDLNFKVAQAYEDLQPLLIKE